MVVVVVQHGEGNERHQIIHLKNGQHGQFYVTYSLPQ